MSSAAAQSLTFALYALAAACWAFPLVLSKPNNAHRGQSRRWLIVGLVLLVLLGLDRLFWFNHLVADQIRDLAHEQGWYDRRRKWQAILLALTMLLLASAWFFRARLARDVSSGSASMCNLTLLTLLGFCFIRAMSNHYVDRVLVHEIAGLRVHWVMEWLLLSALMASTIWELRSRGQSEQPLVSDHSLDRAQ